MPSPVDPVGRKSHSALNELDSYARPEPIYEVPVGGIEADASTAAIKAAMAGIEGQALTTDSTYQRWLARNKDNPAYAGLTDAQKEAAYNTALTKSQEDAASQVPKMVETMNNFFATTDAD